MTQPTGSENKKEASLARRDWIILPLIGLATIVALASTTEWIARRFFYASGAVGETCMGYKDPVVGVKGVPHSVCPEKMVEDKEVVYRFNGSGYRSDVEFGPKAPGTFRIVLLGSSIALGARVPVQDTVATRLAAELTQRTGRPTEIYNEGIMGMGGFPRMVVMRLKDAFDVDPNMMIWIVSAWDIQNAAVVPHPIHDRWDGKRQPPGQTKRRIRQAFATRSISGIYDGLSEVATDWAGLLLNATATGKMLRHYAYDSQSLYLKSYLEQDDDAGFLKSTLSPDWQSHLVQFDKYAAEMAQRARAAGVSWGVVLVPNRAQAAMLSMDKVPAGYNPYTIGDEVRSVVTQHGGRYIDILPDFHAVPNSELNYYPLDGHPDSAGDLLLSQFIADQLAGKVVPEPPSSPQAQAAMKDPKK